MSDFRVALVMADNEWATLCDAISYTARKYHDAHAYQAGQNMDATHTKIYRLWTSEEELLGGEELLPKRGYPTYQQVRRVLDATRAYQRFLRAEDMPNALSDLIAARESIQRYAKARKFQL